MALITVRGSEISETVRKLLMPVVIIIVACLDHVWGSEISELLSVQKACYCTSVILILALIIMCEDQKFLK